MEQLKLQLREERQATADAQQQNHVHTSEVGIVVAPTNYTIRLRLFILSVPTYTW
jgi:hypothetical protein